MTNKLLSLSSGAVRTCFLSSGANTYKSSHMIHLYEPKGPYLRELRIPNKFLPCHLKGQS